MTRRASRGKPNIPVNPHIGSYRAAAVVRRLGPRTSRAFAFLAILPAAVPGMVLGIGYLLVFNAAALSVCIMLAVGAALLLLQALLRLTEEAATRCCARWMLRGRTH
jgi:ABC-type Fe3+ transport system permease subunit